MSYPPAGYGYVHPYPTDPEDAPTRGVSFGGALVLFFRKYARFTGRASQSEYWWMFLWNFLLGIVIAAIVSAIMIPRIIGLIQDGSARAGNYEDSNAVANAIVAQIFVEFLVIWIVAILIGLALVVPYIAVSVRRLHDTNHSGHFFWLYLIPSVGPLIVYILCLFGPDPAGQRFDRPLAQA